MKNSRSHSTLVPIVDFANHEGTQKNAYFDIDPSNNDVLLLLDTKAVQSELTKPIEVFISYSPTEDLFSMLVTYGFTPDFRGNSQFWTVSFDRCFLRNYDGPDKTTNLRLFYKWMHINPVVPLVKYEHNGKTRWFLNDTTPEFDMLLLPFIPSIDDGKIARWAVRFHMSFDVHENPLSDKSRGQRTCVNDCRKLPLSH